MVALAPFSTATAASPRLLFDGHSLSGWKHSAYGLWTVEDGCIVGRFDPAHPGPGYVFTEGEFGDFTLELDFWISKGGNSGVFVRQRLREFGPRGDARPAHGPDDGVEVQIDYNDPKNYTGAIYDQQKPLKVAGAEERWNRYRIQAEGPRLRVWIDDALVNDYARLTSLKGAIGLQMHGGTPHDHVVKFRNIRITLV
jgi:hypothetical protein